MSKLLSHLPALCNVIRRLAQEAGEITLDHFEEGMALGHDLKGDGSPVSIADKKAEDFITRALLDDFPSIPVVGEEAVAAGSLPDLSGEEYFWLVDPLDGTREFVAGSVEYTVNIALIKNHVPVLGVIYAPALDEMYAACGEGTAVKWNGETEIEKAIRVRRPAKSGLTVITSKNRARDEIAKYLEEQKVEKIIRRGSSLKICAVAAGKADLYPGFGQTCEWDTAAGQAILEAAGGELVTLEGEPLRYGDKDGHFYNPSFLARSQYLSGV